MTKEEAERIAWIIGFADDGCPNCVHDLCAIASRKWPEWAWIMAEGADAKDYEEWRIKVHVHPTTSQP